MRRTGTDFCRTPCQYAVMSSSATPLAAGVGRKERLLALFDELGELYGQRNAIDAGIVDVVAEIDGEGLWGGTGCRSIAALVA